MDSITIRKYEPKDHIHVITIFSSGNSEHIKNGINLGRKSPRVLAYCLMLLFSSGLFLSLPFVCMSLIVGTSVHYLSVYLIYKYFVW